MLPYFSGKVCRASLPSSYCPELGHSHSSQLRDWDMDSFFWVATERARIGSPLMEADGQSGY